MHMRLLLVLRLCILYFFFFKQKTAYEMRISDWSSDVCSSDLFFMWRNSRKRRNAQQELQSSMVPGVEVMTSFGLYGMLVAVDEAANTAEIGRASCRERVCQYV